MGPWANKDGQQTLISKTAARDVNRRKVIGGALKDLSAALGEGAIDPPPEKH